MTKCEFNPEKNCPVTCPKLEIIKILQMEAENLSIKLESLEPILDIDRLLEDVIRREVRKIIISKPQAYCENFDQYPPTLH